MRFSSCKGSVTDTSAFRTQFLQWGANSGTASGLGWNVRRRQGTCWECAFNKAADMLDGSTVASVSEEQRPFGEGVLKAALLITDGEPSLYEDGIAKATSMKAAGYTIYGIGVGDDVGTAKFSQVVGDAQATDWSKYYWPVSDFSNSDGFVTVINQIRSAAAISMNSLAVNKCSPDTGTHTCCAGSRKYFSVTQSTTAEQTLHVWVDAYNITDSESLSVQYFTGDISNPVYISGRTTLDGVACASVVASDDCITFVDGSLEYKGDPCVPASTGTFPAAGSGVTSTSGSSSCENVEKLYQLGLQGLLYYDPLSVCRHPPRLHNHRRTYVPSHAPAPGDADLSSLNSQSSVQYWNPGDATGTPSIVILSFCQPF